MPICPKCGTTNPRLAAQCPRDDAYFIHESALEQAENDPRIGTIAADKYVIVGRISKGGMGAVYRAVQLPVEREVAFKVLRTEMEDSDSGRDRFIREARAVSRLTHPNIITLHDFGFESTGHPYMVMEYAPGRDMGEWLREEQLTLDRIVHVTRQLLSSLSDAHRQGIVHRDLKPENMIITSTGSDPDFLKLLDFGIARMINETSTRGLTREGEVFGTPHYMAPEQAQGAKEVGPAADVYAVGIMLYELLTGEPPYDAPTPLAVLMMHLSEPLPEIHPRPSVSLPPAFEAIVRHSVDKDPTVRYQDADAMLQAIDEWMTHEGGFNTGTYRTPFHTPHPHTRDLSGEYSRDTIPGVDTQQSQPGVNLGSYGTSGGGVNVQDPDPSQVYNINTFEEPPPMGQGGSSKAGPLLGALAIFLILIVGGGISYAVLGTEDAVPENDKTIANNNETTPVVDAIKETTPESIDTAMKDPVEVKETTPAIEVGKETTPVAETTPAGDEVKETTPAATPPEDNEKTSTKKSTGKKIRKNPEEKKPRGEDKTPKEETEPKKDEKKIKKDDKWAPPTLEDRKKIIKDDKW